MLKTILFIYIHNAHKAINDISIKAINGSIVKVRNLSKAKNNKNLAKSKKPDFTKAKFSNKISKTDFLIFKT